MGVVNPIVDRDALEKMKEYLRDRSSCNYLIFRVGLNLGLPVQDLLNIQVEDVLDKETFAFQKCNISICKSLQREVQKYVGDRKTGHLFVSADGKPLSRLHLYGVLRSAAKAAGVSDSVGALTLRKTFAYWAYRENQIPLPLLSKYLNHHTVQHTLDYIGLDSTDAPMDHVIAVDL